jgi:hypothetical protein
MTMRGNTPSSHLAAWTVLCIFFLLRIRYYAFMQREVGLGMAIFIWRRACAILRACNEHLHDSPYGPIERRAFWPIYPIKHILAVRARSRRREEAIYTRSSRHALALLSSLPTILLLPAAETTATWCSV